MKIADSKFVIVSILILCNTCMMDAGGNQHFPSTKTNVEILQTLIARITEKIIVASKIETSDTISIKIIQNEDAWLPRQAVTTKLGELGFKVYFVSDSLLVKNILFSLNNFILTVNYDSIYRDWFFGEKKLKRHIYALLSAQVLNSHTGEVLYSGDIADSSTDTIAVDAISSIELTTAKSTQGKLPGENIVDRFIEPFIIIGATCVAVFLFFHVRTE